MHRIDSFGSGVEGEERITVRKKAAASCEDCYFRRAGLCALVLEAPCPTFRAHTRGALSPPRQAPDTGSDLGGLGVAVGQPGGTPAATPVGEEVGTVHEGDPGGAGAPQ